MFTRNVLSFGIVVATLVSACSSTTQQATAVPVNPAQARIYCSGVSEQSANAAGALPPRARRSGI